jgi:hypothetical protein
MEKVETPRHAGSTAPPTDNSAGVAAVGRWSRRQDEGLQIEAQATRWWAAYGGSTVSSR